MSEVVYQNYHMCADVRGVLSLSDRELVRRWKGCIKTDDGRTLHDAVEIRNAFFDELSKGHEVIPMGRCDNFDYKTGCRGHPSAAIMGGKGEGG